MCMQQIGLTKLPGQAALEAGSPACSFRTASAICSVFRCTTWAASWAIRKARERKRPEGHPYLRLTRMLEPGVVVTVEPGIYLIDSLLAAAHADERRAHIDWAVVEELKPYGGIRIEDNVVDHRGDAGEHDPRRVRASWPPRMARPRRRAA